MNARLLILSTALILAACGGGGTDANPPVTVSNLRYSPVVANATLGTISVSGSFDFTSGADLASLRITDSNGTNSTTPISAPGLREGRLTVPATPIPGNPVGFYKFSVWLRDAAGTESNKLDGRIEIKRVAPVAIAGLDAVTPLNSPLKLDGSASTNVNGTPTTYAWSIATLPTTGTVALSSPSTATTNFTCSVPGIFEVQLLIGDGVGQSAPDSLAINCIRVVPIANAGSNAVTYINSPVALDGSASTNANGTPTTYAWNIVTLPFTGTVALSSANTAATNFTCSVPGIFDVRLLINDGMGPSAPDSLAVSCILNSAFTLSSTEADVRRLAGTPSAISSIISTYYEWEYSLLTTVRFSTRTQKVIGWRSYNILLPVFMPFRENVSGPSRIAIGSTKDDVARIQGTPLAVDQRFSYEEWAYDKIGLTYIRFSKATGLVTEYSNYDGSLKV